MLLKFIDWLIRLPEGLAEQLTKKIAILEEEYKMPYVTSWERLGEKKGKKEEKLETAKRMLFNNYSLEEVINITGLTEKEVKALMN